MVLHHHGFPDLNTTPGRHAHGHIVRIPHPSIQRLSVPLRQDFDDLYRFKTARFKAAHLSWTQRSVQDGRSCLSQYFEPGQTMARQSGSSHSPDLNATSGRCPRSHRTHSSTYLISRGSFPGRSLSTFGGSRPQDSRRFRIIYGGPSPMVGAPTPDSY